MFSQAYWSGLTLLSVDGQKGFCNCTQRILIQAGEETLGSTCLTMILVKARYDASEHQNVSNISEWIRSSEKSSSMQMLILHGFAILTENGRSSTVDVADELLPHSSIHLSLCRHANNFPLLSWEQQYYILITMSSTSCFSIDLLICREEKHRLDKCQQPTTSRRRILRWEEMCVWVWW